MIISLSSIPPRFGELDASLSSLLSQSHQAQEIRLYIPYTYRRFPDWNGDLPDLPNGVTIIRTKFDFGPATKVLPAVQDFRGTSTDILFCDDDRVYDQQWAARFVAKRGLMSHCAIAEVGHDLGALRVAEHTRAPRAKCIHKGIRYRALRAATLGLKKLHPWVGSGYVDIAEGYGGVMVRPDFFPDDVFDIPDVLWSVDDYWLSGCMERNGIGIWLNADAKMGVASAAGAFDPLVGFATMGKGREAANAACAAWFQEKHGIW